MTARPSLASPLVIVGSGLVGALLVVAVLAPLLSPFDPRDLTGDALEVPSSRHLLGTNNIGQDIASQLIWGARMSLSLGVGAAGLSVAIGVLIGVTTGLVGGLLDIVVLRSIDVVLALPRLPLLVLVGALAGAGRVTLVLVIALLTWPVIARLARAQTLTLRRRGYVVAARGFGGGLGYVARRHLVPALAPILVTGFVAIAANAVLLEAALAFLGLSDPTAPSWGLVLNRALNHPGIYSTAAWAWWLLPAGFAITLSVLGFAFLGVGLEPVVNPRWQRSGTP